MDSAKAKQTSTATAALDKTTEFLRSLSSIASQSKPQPQKSRRGVPTVDYSKSKSDPPEVLCDPESIDVDIVVVQVLLEDDPDPTWTYDPTSESAQGSDKDKKISIPCLRKKQAKSKQNKGKEVPPSQDVNPHDNPLVTSVNWLKDGDMLQKELPHARIIRFGFRPSVSPNASMEYKRLAKILFDGLVEMRKKGTPRPLIFVGHGFGGIVVQQTILLKGEGCPDGLVKDVAGIIFMVTPFFGSDDLADLIRNRLGELAKTTVSSANLLDTRSDNKALPLIHREFLAKITEAKTCIFCFTEKLKTKVGSTQQEKELDIVGKNGKISDFPYLEVETDFFNFGKFTGQSDRNYRNVVGVLLKFLRTSQLFYAVAEAVKSTDQNYENLKCLLDIGISVDMLNVNGHTALHEVAKTGPLEVASLLIGRGASINYQDGKGMTALHYAVEASLPEMVHFLLQEGADVHIPNNDGISALKIATHKKRNNDKERLGSEEESRNDEKFANDERIYESFRHRPVVERPSSGSPKGPTEVSALPKGGKYVCDNFEMILAEFYFSEGKGRWLIERPTVTDVIYNDGVSPTEILNGARANPVCKWYHLPANNMAWLEDLFVKLGVDVPSPWSGLTQHTHSSRKRFFRPQSHHMPIDKEQQITPLVMPYLNYEIYANQVEMEKTIKNTIERDSTRLTNIEAQLEDFRNRLNVNELLHLPKLKGMELSQSDPESFKSDIEEDAHALSNEPDVKLVEVYLNHKPPLHVRRTLDQAHYYMLPSTEHRDSEEGQVVLRYCKSSSDSDLKESRKMIMVDQLWLWVIPAEAARSESSQSKAPDAEPSESNPSKSNASESESHQTQTSKTDIVISAFPQRWKQHPNDKLNLQNLGLEDPDRPPIQSASDLVSFIVARCCNIFDRSSVPKDLQFFEFFENSIGSVANEEVDLFREFKKASRRIQLVDDKKERAKKLDRLLDITQETALLEHMKDVEDEISVVLTVLRDQKSALIL